MRAVFVGAGTLTVSTARQLLGRGHEVVIIERDREVIDALAGELDCGFLHGDGAKPAVLKEADAEHTDYLFCFTGSDQTNIIAGLVGQSLGFRAVVPKIDDPEFDHICIELGLTHTVIPSRSVGRYLADLFEGRDPLEITAMVRGDARIFSFVARAEDEATIAELGLPKTSRVVCIYRKEEFILADGSTRVREGDEVIVIAHRDAISDLEKRWGRRNRVSAPAGGKSSDARPPG
ncbi:MAG: TrkA family potassium uptake protein [Betaproteobacteria bacterium]|jgi:trk system potassium uptake protein TrkA|nr:TrkA family potassium uptake protein [Betaproteobacteria bacterium]